MTTATYAARTPATTPAQAADGATRHRVLIVIDSAGVSGPVRQLGAVITPLIQAGWDIQCVVVQRQGRPALTSTTFLERMGATVTTLTDTRAFDPGLVTQFTALVDRLKPDIIETHSYRPAVLMAILRLSRRITLPWIGYFHGSTAESLSIKVYNVLDHLALRLSDLVVVMSQLQKAEKAGYRKEVRILYNAAISESSEAETAADLEARLAGAAHPRIGVIGRISPEKGVDLLLTAWRSLVQRGAAGTLVIAGDGPERAACEAQAAAPELQGRVVFLGHLKGTRNLYPLLDLLVIPSRSEGLPNVMLEALQYAALPIVSTRVGAVPELVEGGNAVVLVPTGNADALADAIETTLATDTVEHRNPDRTALLDRLSLDARVAEIGRTYHDVLAQRGATRR